MSCHIMFNLKTIQSKKSKRRCLIEQNTHKKSINMFYFFIRSNLIYFLIIDFTFIAHSKQVLIAIHTNK